MDWIKVSIFTTSEGIEPLSGRLYQLGITGLEIEDEKDFKDFLENNKQYWDYVDDELIKEKEGETEVIAYVSDNAAGHEMLMAIRNTVAEMKQLDDENEFGRLEIHIDNMKEEDWANNWKKYFHQFYVDDILIIPSWEDVKPSDEDKMVIHIDPGTAFGTGMHETTQLCIRQIRKYTTETTKILDVGCGSGILGMLALKFGAEHSVGTDLDSCAIDATYENMENNGISGDKYEVMIGNIINDKEVQDKVGYECYDIVAANILAPVLVELTPVIVNQLKPGGIYITSGIIDDKEEMVKEAVAKAGLELLDVTYQGEWVCVTARKNA